MIDLATGEVAFADTYRLVGLGGRGWIDPKPEAKASSMIRPRKTTPNANRSYEEASTVPTPTAAEEEEPHVLNKRLIGSQISRKRRLLGLKPETTVRKTPLWALIAYPCAGFRTEKHRVADPLEEPWARLRTFLWATPIAMALTFAGSAAPLVAGSAISGTRAGNGNSLQDLAPPPQPADIEILGTARTLRCDFDDMPSDIVIDGVNHGTGFGEARIVGNVGASDALSVLGREMVSFIEFLPNAVNTITVYASKDNELRFVAVYSRHTAIFGAPTPSQQRGSCQVLR